MRVTLVVVLVLVASPARADRGGFVEASAGASYGSLTRTAIQADEYGDFTTVEHGRGPGEDLRLTAGFELRNGARLGGWFRASFLQMDIDNYYSDLDDSTRLRSMLLGVSVAKATRRGLYGRADLGFGSNKQATDGDPYWPRSDWVIALSVEAGVERQVAPNLRVQVGVGLLLEKIRYAESGDVGDYTYDTTILAPSLVVSIGRSF